MTQHTHLLCPLDHLPLSHKGHALCCTSGHHYDIGKPGYVNLLPVQFKRSKSPGDSKAMVDARYAVLESGAYDAIAEAVTATVVKTLAAQTNPRLLDAGCGEGFYLNHLMNQRPSLAGQVTGLDISKDAIQKAAKRRQDVTWLVASNKAPPVAAGSIDLILCLFGFPLYPVFKRVLAPGGFIVLADAGPDHLIELRRVIYPDVRQKPLSALTPALDAGFRLVSESTVSIQTPLLPQALLHSLLVMTPHLYRASAEGKAAANALDGLSLTLDVGIRVLQSCE